MFIFPSCQSNIQSYNLGTELKAGAQIWPGKNTTGAQKTFH